MNNVIALPNILFPVTPAESISHAAFIMTRAPDETVTAGAARRQDDQPGYGSLTSIRSPHVGSDGDGKIDIDCRHHRAYKSSTLGEREGGENPLLPRNCERQDASKDFATGQKVWEGSSNPL